MKINYQIRLTKRIAVFAGVIGLSAFLGIPVIAKPAIKGAGSAAGMAHNKQNATPSITPSISPSTGSGPTSNPAPISNPAPTSNPSTGSASSNLVQVASADSSFSTLVQAVKAAGLASTLANKGPFTIFAPTNQAFAALPKGAVQLLLKPENKKLLQRLLAYHVVPGKLNADQIKTGSLKTLGGGLAVEVNGNKVIINNASVSQANIEASNGVIHAINRVLMSRELRQTIVAKLKAQ